MDALLSVIFVVSALIVVLGLSVSGTVILMRKLNSRKLSSITKVIFVMAQVAALVWISSSYALAIYSTICLGQVYTLAELSEPAIHTILGVSVLKVVENLFEHNDGGIFGKSHSTSPEQDNDN